MKKISKAIFILNVDILLLSFLCYVNKSSKHFNSIVAYMHFGEGTPWLERQAYMNLIHTLVVLVSHSKQLDLILT